ncbi:MAG: hypothetical protein AB7H85_06530 [Dehalococcoidia bacterium]
MTLLRELGNEPLDGPGSFAAGVTRMNVRVVRRVDTGGFGEDCRHLPGDPGF